MNTIAVVCISAKSEDYSEFENKMDDLLSGQNKSLVTIITIPSQNNFGVRCSIRNHTCLMTFNSEDEAMDFAKLGNYIIYK